MSDITADFKHLSLFDTQKDDLFAPPPMRSDCPICFIPLPIECDEYGQSPCCGNTICCGCLDFIEKQDNESSRACPFCRALPTKDDEEHLARSKKRVELGDAEITFCMGCYYSWGSHGLPKDGEKAFELFLQAAELGSARACANVGFEYRAGVFAEKNESKERYFLEKAAKLGEPRGRYGLAALEERKGNIEMALRHWKIAAVQGLSFALPHILYCYQLGMLSKDEYSDILRASQKAKDSEWSKQRELSNQTKKRIE